MLFVLWFKWAPEKTEEVIRLWKGFKFPKEVKEIGRYLLIGRHISVAIFDAPSEEAILKITYPFRNLGIPHVNPALPSEEALRMMEHSPKTDTAWGKMPPSSKTDTAYGKPPKPTLESQ